MNESHKKQDGPSYKFTVVLAGSFSIGKTCFFRRCCRNAFKPEFRVTLVPNWDFKDIEVDGKKVKLQIWDFSGQAIDWILLPHHRTGAFYAHWNLCDTLWTCSWVCARTGYHRQTSIGQDENLVRFHQKLCPPNTKVLLLAHLLTSSSVVVAAYRCDLVDWRKVREKDIADFCSEHGIEKWFTHLPKQVKESMRLWSNLTRKMIQQDTQLSKSKKATNSAC